jgi:hypothetical protein
LIDAPRPGDFVTRSPKALSANIDGEVVALDIARGACYGLDAIASRVWALIETPRTIDDLRATLMVEYRVDAETCVRDVVDLIIDLRAEGLVSIESAPPSPGD